MLSRVCMEVVAHTMQPKQIEQLKKEFSAFDTDNTGTISYRNLRKALETSTGLGEDELEKLFKDINFDHTGEINYHEFVAATMSRTSIREENLKSAFFKISNNADYFTADDLARLAGVDTSPERVR
jgi:calcium-dependent protein kinase